MCSFDSFQIDQMPHFKTHDFPLQRMLQLQRNDVPHHFNIFFGRVNNAHLCSQSKLKPSQELVILSVLRRAPRVPSSAVWFHRVPCMLPSPSQLFNCFEVLNLHYLCSRSRVVSCEHSLGRARIGLVAIAHSQVGFISWKSCTLKWTSTLVSTA